MDCRCRKVIDQELINQEIQSEMQFMHYNLLPLDQYNNHNLLSILQIIHHQVQLMLSLLFIIVCDTLID